MTTGGGFIAGSIVGKLLLDKTGWNQSISAVDKDAAKLGNSAKQIGDQFQAAGKAMAIAGTAVVGALSAMIVKAARYGDEMVEISQKVGINVTTLSSYKLAADKTGTSIDGMARGLKFLSANIVEASNGTGDGARIFKALGISVTDATGKLRSTDDVLADVAQAFSGLEGGAVKTTTAVKLFGRSGMEMVPFLNLGADGIKREREEAERLGLVLTGEAAEAQNHFKDQLDALKDATFGVAVTIGTALIPVVQGAVDSMIKFAAGITSAVKAHPELIKVLGAAGLALGTVGMAIGSVIMLLPRFVAGLTALKTLLSTTALGVGAFTAALTVGVGVIVYYLSKLSELSTAEDELNKASQVLRETENQLVDKLSAAAIAADWQYGRMSALIEAYHGNIAALVIAIKRGKEGVDIQNALAEVGKKHADAIEEQKKKMGEMDPVTRALNDALATQKKTTEELTETWAPLARGVSFVRDVMQGFSGELTNTFIPAAQDMSLIMAAAPGTFDETGRAADGLDTVFKALGDSIGMSAATVVVAMYNIRAAVLSSMGIILPLLEMPDVANKVRSTMDEVSTVVADAMRDIARSIVEALNIKGLFGAVAISVKFDSSGFDAMVKAAESAYDKIKDATNKAFDLQELRISRTQEAEDRQRSWTEKFEDRAIARGYEREDRKFQHQYEHERAAIEHSKMTEAQKNAALDKLERKYQHEQDVREMQRQHAADVRERARENAAVARERAREEAKYKREQVQAAKLLALQWKHENDLNAIRIAEDAARQKQATDEETRQKSLWFKVKGIFATAIEQMLTIWITNLITPILTSIVSKILPGIKGIGDGAKDTLGPKGLGKTVSDAATSIGNIFTTLATTISTILTTLATGIATSIVTIGTAIGTVIVGLATAIASAAEIIAASAPAFIVVGLIAVGIYATIALLKRLFASSSSGAGDGMGRVVERQDIQISLMTILKDLTIDNRTALTSIKTTLWTISMKLDKGVKDKLVIIGGYLKTIASTHYLTTVVSYLKKIADTIGKLTGAAAAGATHVTTTGGYSGQNVSMGSSQPAHVAIPQAVTNSRNQGSSTNITFHVNAIDRAGVETFLRRDAKPILQRMLARNDLRVPASAVGGP